MKKVFKKITSFAVIAVLALSTAACGSKSSSSSKVEDMSSKDLFAKISTATEDVKAISAKAEFDGKLTMSVQGQEAEMSAKGSIESKTTTDPKATYAKIEYSVNALGQEESATSEMYSVVNDDTVDSYVNDGEGWSYDSEDLSEYEDAIDQITSSFKSLDFDEVSKYCDSIDTKASGSNYEITAKVSSGKIVDIAKEYFAGTSEEIDLSSIPDFEINVTITVDGKTYLPKSMEITADADEFELQGATCNLDKCTLSFTVESYDDVTITVPDEAKEAE